MQVQQHTHGAVTVVKPLGSITGEDADLLRDQLTQVRERSLGRLVLDASAVPYIDSRGLEVLLEANEALAAGGQTLKLCGVSDVLREVLDVTDLASLFEHFEDVNGAVRSFL